MNLQPNQKHIHLYIANEEVVCSNQISIVEELTNTNTIILNNCYPLSWETTKDYTKYYIPKDYSLFKMVYDYSGYDLMTENNEDILTEAGETIDVGNTKVVAFVGIIKRSQPIDLNPNKAHFATLQVLDFKTFLNEGELFNFVITETTVKNFIETVINAYSGYNFTVGKLNLGDKLNQIIGNYNCDQKTLFDVLQYISQVTNSIWKVRYVNDTNYAIDFYDVAELPKGRDIVYDKDYSNNNSIVNISYSFNASNYRNKQVMTGPNVIAHTDNIEEITTNSNDNQYKLDNNIGIITNATLDNIQISVATTEYRNNGFTADLYYTVGSNTVELINDTLPTQILRISYYPYMEGRTINLNTNEIARINTQLTNTGIISRYEKRQDATSLDELAAIGETYLQYKGQPEITLTIKTINNDIWQVGQKVFFDNNNVDELLDLKGDYAVKKKTTQIYQNNADSSNQTIYIYELNNNYNFENEINFFDNQRAKTKGNIEEGQYINKYIDKIETIKIVFAPILIN